MKIVFDTLHFLGFNNITTDSELIVIYSACIFLMSILGLLCFMNLMIYFLIITFIDNKILNNWEATTSKFLKYLSPAGSASQRVGKILKKIVQFYRSTRIFYIVLEIVLFLWIILTLIYTSYIIISI